MSLVLPFIIGVMLVLVAHILNKKSMMDAMRNHSTELTILDVFVSILCSCGLVALCFGIISIVYEVIRR